MGAGQGRTLGVMRKSSGWRSMGPPGRPNQAAILGQTYMTGHSIWRQSASCMCKKRDAALRLQHNAGSAEGPSICPESRS